MSQIFCISQVLDAFPPATEFTNEIHSVQKQTKDTGFIILYLQCFHNMQTLVTSLNSVKTYHVGGTLILYFINSHQTVWEDRLYCRGAVVLSADLQQMVKGRPADTQLHSGKRHRSVFQLVVCLPGSKPPLSGLFDLNTEPALLSQSETGSLVIL